MLGKFSSHWITALGRPYGCLGPWLSISGMAAAMGSLRLLSVMLLTSLSMSWAALLFE